MIDDWVILGVGRDNVFMAQLQLFSRSEVAAMRDRTRSRNYSAEGDEFRRVHERHRRWGLARRYALKRCRLQGCSAECAAVGLHDPHEAVPPLIWPAGVTRGPRPSRPGACRDVPADRDPPPGNHHPGDSDASAAQASLAGRAPAATAETAPRADPERRAATASRACSTGQDAAADRSVASVCTEPADHTKLVDRAEPADRTEPVDRTEPADRTGSGDRMGSGDRTEPADHTKPGNRTRSRNHTEPADHTKPAPRTKATKPTAATARFGSSQHHWPRLIRDSTPRATSPTTAPWPRQTWYAARPIAGNSDPMIGGTLRSWMGGTPGRGAVRFGRLGVELPVLVVARPFPDSHRHQRAGHGRPAERRNRRPYTSRASTTSPPPTAIALATAAARWRCSPSSDDFAEALTTAHSATPHAPRTPRQRHGPENRRGKSDSTRDSKPEDARPPPGGKNYKDFKQPAYRSAETIPCSEYTHSHRRIRPLEPMGHSRRLIRAPPYTFVALNSPFDPGLSLRPGSTDSSACRAPRQLQAASKEEPDPRTRLRAAAAVAVAVADLFKTVPLGAW